MMSITPNKPVNDGNSLIIKGDVASKNNGVKESIGTVIDRSEDLIAFIYSMEAKVFIDPPIISAGQNLAPISGILKKKTVGNKKSAEKRLRESERVYSLRFLRLCLAVTSFADSKKTFKRDKIGQNMLRLLLR